jgi:hypothetical protein
MALTDEPHDRAGPPDHRIGALPVAEAAAGIPVLRASAAAVAARAARGADVVLPSAHAAADPPADVTAADGHPSPDHWARRGERLPAD